MTKSGPSIIRLPITTPILEKIRVALDRSSHPHKLALWAIACGSFFFLASSDLENCCLNWRDASTLLHLSPGGTLQLDSQANPTMLKVHLKKVKM